MPKSELDLDILQQVLGRRISDEELGEVALFNRGSLLRSLTPTPVWDEILGMLRSYIAGAVEELMAESPANKDQVLAQHAVAFALANVYNKFVRDVQEAVDFASKPPKVVLEQLQHHTVGPPPGL